MPLIKILFRRKLIRECALYLEYSSYGVALLRIKGSLFDENTRNYQTPIHE